MGIAGLFFFIGLARELLMDGSDVADGTGFFVAKVGLSKTNFHQLHVERNQHYEKSERGTRTL